MPACLVVYYSLSGNTRAAAQALHEELGADLREIRHAEPRSGMFGMLRSLWETLTGRSPEIRSDPIDLSGYSLVVLATPVWAWRPAAPMQTFVAARAGGLPNVAVLCTYGGSGAEATFDRLAQAVGKTPLATVAISDADRRSGDDAHLLEAFVGELRDVLLESTTPHRAGREPA